MLERFASGLARPSARESAGLVRVAGAALLCATAAAHAQPAPHATPDAWPLYRGDPALLGMAASDLPERPEVLWRVTLPAAIDSSAAIADGIVYVGCDDGHLYARALDDGRPLWKFNAGAEVRAAPTVYAGRVYVGDEAGVMHAVDARSGEEVWKLATEGEIYSAVNVAGDRLLFGSYDGHVYCVAPDDGKVIWKYLTGDRVHGTPGVLDGLAFTAGCDAQLHVVEVATGTARHKVPLGSVCGAAAACRAGWTWLGTYGDEIVGVNWGSDRQEVAWRFQDPDRQFPFMSSAAVKDDTIYIGGRDKRFRALDARRGSQKWEFRLDGRVDSSGVIVGERVFFGASDGRVYALRLADGTEAWRFEAGDGITATPAVAAGRLVIGTFDGSLYCFGARE